jgi:hypothetical protein
LKGVCCGDAVAGVHGEEREEHPGPAVVRLGVGRLARGADAVAGAAEGAEKLGVAEMERGELRG